MLYGCIVLYSTVPRVGPSLWTTPDGRGLVYELSTEGSARGAHLGNTKEDKIMVTAHCSFVQIVYRVYVIVYITFVHA